jgi:integrase
VSDAREAMATEDTAAALDDTLSPAKARGDGFSGRQFDRVYPEPVGRIVKAWGVSQKRLRQSRAALVEELNDHGQEEVLLAFKSGRYKWADLLRAKRQGRIDSPNLAVDLTLDRPLWPGLWDERKPGALASILPRMGATDGARARYKSALLNLQSAAADFLPDGALVQALGQMSEEDWRTVWEELATLSAASRNRVRSAVSRFLSLFLNDKYHPFRRELMRRMGAFEKEGSAEPRTIELAEFWTLMDALPSDVREPLLPCYVTLAATGMRVSEYLQCGADALRQFPTIAAPGGKTGARSVAVAPELEAVIRAAIPCAIAALPEPWASSRGLKTPEPYPGVQYDARYGRLYAALRAAAKATGIPASPHYLRHLFGALAVDETNQVFAQHALGHETPGMTAHYAKRKTTREVGAKVGAALMRGRT